MFVKFWSLSGFRLTEIACITVASHACVFRGALISSLKNESPPPPPPPKKTPALEASITGDL